MKIYVLDGILHTIPMPTVFRYVVPKEFKHTSVCGTSFPIWSNAEFSPNNWTAGERWWQFSIYQGWKIWSPGWCRGPEWTHWTTYTDEPPQHTPEEYAKNPEGFLS